MSVIDIKNTEIAFRDGTPNFLILKIGEGNLTYTEKVNREYIRDRGTLDSVRNGDEEPVEVSMDFQWEFLTEDSGDPTPSDVLKKQGQASSWVTSGADACEPYCVDIIIEYEPGCSPTKSERIILPEYRYESLSHDLRNSTLSTSGMCNVTAATLARYDASDTGLI